MLAFRLTILFLLTAEIALSGAAFTNSIRFLDEIAFELTDGHGPADAPDSEMQSTNFIHYLVIGKGTNKVMRAALRRDEMPVVLELRDPAGKPVPRTPMGLTNAVVPKRETRILLGSGVVAEGPTLLPRRRPQYSRGQAIRATSHLIGPVGLITDFFDIGQPGTYTLEARLRYWCFTNKTYMWFLTEPVRLRIIVPDPKAQSNHLSQTNASAAAFTNRIKSLDDIYFGIIDHEGPPDNSTPVAAEAGNYLQCTIHHRGSRRVQFALRRGEMPLLLELTQPDGDPVPPTGLGIKNAMLLPEFPLPGDIFDFIESGSAQNRSVGVLTNLFQITEPGTYTLRARLRYWQPTNDTFTWFLSQPIHVPVILRDPSVQQQPRTNAAPSFQWPPWQSGPRGPLPGEWTPPNAPVYGKDFATFNVKRRFVDPGTLFRNDVGIRLPSHTKTNRLVAELHAQSPPISMAVTVDDPSRTPESAWVPFRTNYLLSLPEAEGHYRVKFSFRFADKPTYADIRRVHVDTTPPLMIFTNPPNLTVAQCQVRLQGYFPEPVYKLHRRIISGFEERELLECSHPAPDLKTDISRFDCHLDLLPGPNQILFTGEDRAGNHFSTNFTVVVNKDNRPPKLVLANPSPNALVEGDHIAISGETDDPATQVLARIFPNTPAAKSYGAICSPDGKFLIRDVPVKPGTNLIQLLLTDCAGFNTLSNLILIKRN